VSVSAGETISRESIEEYLPLVQQMVRRFVRKLPSNVGRDDLMAAGVFGLMDALRKNGGNQGPAFEWYARIRIRGAIVDELRQQDWLPRRARWAVSSGVDKGQGGAATAVVSLEDMAVGEQSTALVDEETANPAEQAEANDTRKRLERAVSMLPDRERLIVSMHYFEGVRFKEIGALLGVSEPRISQLHARAMEKLRACLQEDEASARTALRVVKSLDRARHTPAERAAGRLLEPFGRSRAAATGTRRPCATARRRAVVGLPLVALRRALVGPPWRPSAPRLRPWWAGRSVPRWQRKAFRRRAPKRFGRGGGGSTPRWAAPRF
jgi:RNA polymerase sigma factor for flagellar operon FliA